jgi:hypothetical protein
MRTFRKTHYVMLMWINIQPTVGRSIMNIGAFFSLKRRLSFLVKDTCFLINAVKNSVFLIYKAASLSNCVVEMCIAGHINTCR